MCVSVCACVHLCTCICDSGVYLCVHLCLSGCISMCVSLCVSVCTCVCLCSSVCLVSVSLGSISIGYSVCCVGYGIYTREQNNREFIFQNQHKPFYNIFSPDPAASSVADKQVSPREIYIKCSILLHFI